MVAYLLVMPFEVKAMMRIIATKQYDIILTNLIRSCLRLQSNENLFKKIHRMGTTQSTVLYILLQPS